jgi:hypothetical protein
MMHGPTRIPRSEPLRNSFQRKILQTRTIRYGARMWTDYGVACFVYPTEYKVLVSKARKRSLIWKHVRPMRVQEWDFLAVRPQANRFQIIRVLEEPACHRQIMHQRIGPTRQDNPNSGVYRPQKNIPLALWPV